ncbi:MAG: hypothetical protein OFPII_37730 [Osedax symbiont Rs1]|nr:MAG: hypothetical protein OFPII_37730 [Osedax symbiont Rs1]
MQISITAAVKATSLKGDGSKNVGLLLELDWLFIIILNYI